MNIYIVKQNLQLEKNHEVFHVKFLCNILGSSTYEHITSIIDDTNKEKE